MARIIGLAIGAIAAVLVCMPGLCHAAANISVLYTGDTHGHLKSYYYESVKPVGGVAKRAIFFQDRRQHKKMNWLVLDSGDAISGTALSDVFQGFLDIESMNRLGYDAMCLGVHEFDYGVPVLKQRISEAKFPIVCANVTTADGQPFTKPYVIVDRGGVKIAILGLVTGELDKRVAPENFSGLTVADPIETARVLVPQLRQQAELVFVLSHLGVNEDIRLSTKVQGIDAIIGGMSHSELQEGIYAKPTIVVHSGLYGRYVGQLKLSFSHDESGRMVQRYCENSLVLMDGKYKENSDYVAWLNSFAPQFQEKMGTLIGSSAARMDDRMLASYETELGNYVCDILKSALGADAALLPAAFFGGPMPEGVVTLGDLFTMMPFDHYAQVVNLTGAELQQVLNEAANNLGKPGFAQVSGINFAIYGSSAYSVQVNGQPIDPYGRYRLATSDYLATGALGYSVLGTVKDTTYSGRLIRDIVRKQLANGEVASATIYRRIRLVADAPEQTPASTTPPQSEEQPPVEDTGTSAPAAEETQPAADDSASQPPAEPGSEEGSDGQTRYDRNGQPMEEQPVIEDETITDTGSDLPAAEQPAEQPEETPVEDTTAETPPATEEPASSAGISEALGRDTQSINGLDYEFFLVQTDKGYDFHLNILNNTAEPVQLSFPTSERFDFQAYYGTDLLWSFNANRFFVQSEQSENLAPGDSLEYRGVWDGLTNSDEPLPANELNFIAIFAASGAPVQLSFNAVLPK